MAQFTNSDKQEHGQNAKNTMEEILKKCEDFSYIKKTIKDYRCGYKGFSGSQFYCNFLIVFQDDTKWIIKITTSFRSDRIKGNQWDSFNIKEIDPSISKSVLVYPDDLPESEKEKFIVHKLKIVNHQHFSSIDDIVGQNELFELIENYAYKDLKLGSRRGKAGNNFEDYIANILSYQQNLEKWNTNNPKLVGMQYNFFEKILVKFEIEKKEVVRIEATSDKKEIGRLSSGGNAKTDIIVTCQKRDGNSEIFTISCKKTQKDEVAVGEYKSDDYADVLDAENEKLRNLLYTFQDNPTLSDFGKENGEKLEREIKPYLRKLIRFVIGGYGGKNQDPLQCADYILIGDGEDIFIHTLEEYTDLLLKYERNFGTPFSWTYESGRRGKCIKLKVKVIK